MRQLAPWDFIPGAVFHEVENAGTQTSVEFSIEGLPARIVTAEVDLPDGIEHGSFISILVGEDGAVSIRRVASGARSP